MKKIAFLFLVLLSLSKVFCQEQAKKQLNVISSISNYDMNPYTASSSVEAQLFTGIYEGLFSYNPGSLIPEPAICESYKISRDKKRWTFTLRDNVCYSNGKKITAKDFRRTWIKLLKTPNAPFASLIDCISGAKDLRTGKGKEDDVKIIARDDKTLIIHLTEPAAHLPKILCNHAFTAVPEEKGVYSGAFAISSQSENEIVLSKSKTYWDKKNVKLETVRISLGDDFSENAFDFNTGKAQWVCGNADSAKILNKTSIQVTAEFATLYLFFKMQNSPWDKVEFRQALLEAIPYDELRKDFSIPAQTFISRLQGYPEVTGYSDYDADYAKYLMEAARKKYNVQKNVRFPIVLGLAETELSDKWVSILEKAWSPLGVDVVVQKTDNVRYNSAIPQWNADIFSYSWVGDFADPQAFLELFKSDSSLNVANYKNKEFDDLVLQSMRARSLSEQYELQAKAEQLLLDEAMVIPIMHPVSLHFINTNEVGGFEMNALDLHPYKYIYFKERENVVVPHSKVL